MASALAVRSPPDTRDIMLIRRRVEQDPYEPLGIRAGAFVLRPAIEFTSGYDNNPSRATDGGGSWLLFVAPELLVRSRLVTP